MINREFICCCEDCGKKRYTDTINIKKCSRIEGKCTECGQMKWLITAADWAGYRDFD